MKELKCIKCNLLIPFGVTCRIKQILQDKSTNVDVEKVEHLHNCLTEEGKQHSLALIEQDKKFKEGLNANRNRGTEDIIRKEEGSGSSVRPD